MANFMRLDYDQLGSVKSQMLNESQHMGQLLTELQRRIDGLVGSDWQGDAAVKFEDEMTSEILPALKRLANSLEVGSAVAGKIEQIVQSADQGASALFKNIF